MVDQIRRLVARGFNEVVLTGVDLTSWGADLPAAPRLGDLVRRILRLVPDLPRLRISSINSIEADPALMEAIATEPRLMPHLHLSAAGGRRPDPEADEAPPPARRRHRASARRRGGCAPT